MIVSRSASAPYLTAVIEATYGIIFMGTPHAGADLAALGASLTKLANILNKSNAEIVKVLEPTSAMLARVQQGFHTMLEKRRAEEAKVLKMYCFYEEIPIRTIGKVCRPLVSEMCFACKNQSLTQR